MIANFWRLLPPLALALSGLAPAVSSAAGPLMVGRETALNISVPPEGLQNCNIEILLPTGERIERELAPPDFETVVPFTPRSEGPQTVYWEGKFRFKGSLSVSGCNGRYSRRLEVKPAPEQIGKVWETFYAPLSPKHRECIETGLARRNLRGAAADPTTLPTPDSPQAKPVLAACERFVALKPRVDVECPVSARDPRKTRCNDVYVLVVGRSTRVIDESTAVEAVLSGKTVKLEARESDTVRSERLQAEQDARDKLAAEEAAKAAAEEKELVRKAEEATRKAEAEAAALKKAEDERLAEIARKKRLRCLNGRCFDLGF